MYSGKTKDLQSERKQQLSKKYRENIHTETSKENKRTNEIILTKRLQVQLFLVSLQRHSEKDKV
jgi:hypothetical protein